MDSNHPWTITIDGATSTAPDTSAAVGILLAALRQHTGCLPVGWQIDRDGSVALIGTAFFARPDMETESDGWFRFWADSIWQQLGQASVGAS